jgi:hypothetical protein
LPNGIARCRRNPERDNEDSAAGARFGGRQVIHLADMRVLLIK